MDIYTADERFHQNAARAAQRARYRRWPEDPRRVLAAAVEAEVAGRLRERGYFVARTGHNENFDLLVNGLRVEVKASTWSHGRYQAALRGNDADILVFGCQNGSRHFFVIPFEEVRGLTNLCVYTADPERSVGRWRHWLEAWPVLDAAIRRGLNHWQMPLLEQVDIE